MQKAVEEGMNIVADDHGVTRAIFCKGDCSLGDP